MRAAVIGAGIMGASTALALTRRGHRVTLFEQFEPGHDRGSSHGRSRIVRRAYPDPFYTAIMNDAYPLWGRLEAELGEPILHECGLLYFGSRDADNVRSVIDSLLANDVPHQVFDASDVRTVFPELRLDPDEVGVFTPEAGWVAADRAIAGSLRLARDQGAEVVRSRVDQPEDLAGEFDRVLVCAGAWVLQWYPIPARVAKQTFAYVPVASPHHGPVWIEDGTDGTYGFPSEPGATTVKIGIHRLGPELDPDSDGRDPERESMDSIAAFALRRFGEAAAPTHAKTCLYTATEDEDFRFGQIRDSIFWASPCSGHGFKFGPWVGEIMADFAEGARSLAGFPRFHVPSGTRTA